MHLLGWLQTISLPRDSFSEIELVNYISVIQIGFECYVWSEWPWMWFFKIYLIVHTCWHNFAIWELLECIYEHHVGYIVSNIIF